MDYNAFYRKLFKPLETTLGPVDESGIFHIIGFDCGGPLNFSTFSTSDRDGFSSYVSCELAVKKEQIPASCGRYELLVTANDQDWVRSVLTEIGRMSLEVCFDGGHTLDISACTGEEKNIRGVVFEVCATTSIRFRKYGILRCHGVTFDEMNYAQTNGSAMLLNKLKERGIYPKTDIHRRSIFY